MVRVALIGAGGFARKHMEVLAAMEDVRIAGVWNRSRQRAEDVAAEIGAKAYSEVEELLDRGKPDCAFLSLIPAAHGTPEALCVDREIPFFVEKPVARDRETAQSILAAVRRKNLLTSVGYQWRYLDLVDRVREFLRDHPAFMAHGFWLSKLSSLPWWKQRKLSGGPIVEQTTHMFDLARWLFGEPSDVQGFRSRAVAGDGGDVEAASTVNARFPSGVVANFSSSCRLPVRYRGGFIVFTPDAVLELLSRASGTENTVLNVVSEAGTTSQDAGNHPLKDQDRAFIEAVRTGNRGLVRCDYADAAKTLWFTLAAYESMEKSTVVEIGEEP